MGVKLSAGLQVGILAGENDNAPGVEPPALGDKTMVRYHQLLHYLCNPQKKDPLCTTPALPQILTPVYRFRDSAKYFIHIDSL